MHIKLRIYQIKYEYETRHQLYINGTLRRSIAPLSECPENAIIERDLIDGLDLIEMLRMGYEAHQNGEDFVVEIDDSPFNEELDGD